MPVRIVPLASFIAAPLVLGSIGATTILTRGGVSIIDGDGGRSGAKGPIWSSTNKLSSIENAYGHWTKHRAEFPEFANAKQYVEAAHAFASNPPPGTLTKVNAGRTVLYHEPSNTFAVVGADGAPRTMFRPDPALHGYKTNMDYFNAQ